MRLQDTSWLDIYLSHIPHVVYQVDDPENTVGAQHATLANKGNEAMAYLQFIVDYYDRLPPVMIFLHGHRCNSILGGLSTPCGPSSWLHKLAFQETRNTSVCSISRYCRILVSHQLHKTLQSSTWCYFCGSIAM